MRETGIKTNTKRFFFLSLRRGGDGTERQNYVSDQKKGGVATVTNKIKFNAKLKNKYKQ